MPAVFAQADSPRETHVIMRDIFSQLRRVVPVLVDADVLEDPERRAQVRAALEAIEARAEELDAHGAHRFDPGRDQARRSLAADARRTLERLEANDLDSARFFALRLSESCVACHARLPAEDSPFAAGFFESKALESLDPVQRAQLEIATRRFDTALTELEGLLRSNDRLPAELLGPLVDYLTVCVRVKGDLKRPLATLERFAKRDDLWSQLREDVDGWIADLRAYGAEPRVDGDLKSARAQLERGRLRVRYPSDRRALIDYLIASRTLHRVVAAQATPTPDLAEAYYLLGLVESRIGRNDWLSQSDIYLETSVRLAPGTDLARTAYALLEEELIVGYSGSSGTHLPPDERARLDRLHGLAYGSPAGAGP